MLLKFAINLPMAKIISHYCCAYGRMKCRQDNCRLHLFSREPTRYADNLTRSRLCTTDKLDSTAESHNSY